jgi:hypothetical protein
VLNVIAYSAMTVADTYTQAQADAKFVQQTTNFFAGKNRIINGDFGVWQRGTSFSITADAYTSDRWVSQVNGNGTRTVSQQTFTPGTAPVAGYEGQFFLRMACTASGTATYFNIKQKIEDVRTFAGQTITVSFWAKASASLTTGFFGLTQDFGSGGSSAVDTAGTNLTFTTSWARYTQTFAIPSISGKTIGTGSNLALAVSFGSGTFTSFDIWGVQVEAGSIATPFQTATGTIAGELAACQRYFQIIADGSGQSISMLAAYSSTNAYGVYQSKVTMRTTPTIYQVSGTNYFLILGNGLDNDTFDSVTALENGSSNAVRFSITSGISMTQGYSYWFQTNNASARLGLQAEL